MLKNSIYYILGIAFLIASDLVEISIPKMIGRIVDILKHGTVSINLSEMSSKLWIFVFLSFLLLILRFFRRKYFIGVVLKLEYAVRNHLFSKFLRLPQAFYDRARTGDLMARATNDVSAVRKMAGRAVLISVDAIFLILVVLAVMIKAVGIKLTLMGVSPFPGILIISTVMGRKIRGRFRNVQEGFSRLSESVQESFSGIAVVKGYAQEEGEIEKFEKLSMDYATRNLSLIKIWGALHPLVRLLAGTGTVLTILFGGKMVMEGKLTLGTLIAQTAYLGMLVFPMTAFGWIIGLIEMGLASLKRLDEIMRKEELEYGEESGMKIHGNVEFEMVSFKYPGSKKLVLKNVSFNVKKGEILGITGRVGSGKSTIAKLLVRMYETECGKILVDGEDLRKIPRRDLLKHVALVPQETFLFSTTVKDNIAFGKEDVSLEEIKKVAKLAGIHDTIISLPKGYETVVGERGVKLSGGEKQRIALARALMMDPKILILDDALSAVDLKTEEMILNNLKGFMRERTTIIISHRIRSVREADHILVLEDGKIVEEGTHEELMNLKGLYYEMGVQQSLEEGLRVI
ncbi:MAG: ABC transporter ATP-binding protein [Thermotoga sp.]|nr:MAG: ABC transporter ATP-binding protein [Thermotoga sp.]